jgi:hypothetical protein
MHRIILVRNGEYKSTLYRCKTRKSAFIKFRKISEENEDKIMFPKIYVHSANPIGAHNICGWINNFLKNEKQPETCVRVQIEHTVEKNK